MKRSVLILFGNALLILITACTSTKNKLNKPNIILIYADDLGIGLLGHEGQQIIRTPNIDQLAEDGMRFTRAYSNMLCAPARASLITGLHDCHENSFDINRGGAYLKADTSSIETIENSLNEKLSPIPLDQVFLGNIAQEQGYRTAQIGKLEWGFSATDQQMKRHGWDHYYGYLDHIRAHGFYPPFLFENGEMIEIQGNTLLNAGKSKEPETPESFNERWNMEGKEVYSQDIFMDKILSYIDANEGDPFLLYFPTQLPHGPVSTPTVHPDFINDDRLTQIEKEYASMVKLLDHNVGQIIAKLDEKGLSDNTIVIFTADNGHEIYYGQKGRVQKPYTNQQTGERFDNYERKYYSELAGDVFNGNGGRAGLKRSNLEGGINVPLIIKWPKTIKEGETSDRLIANYDILPTLAQIIGNKNRLKVDGLSFYNELVSETADNEHEFVVYSSYYGPTLITKDGWKLRTYAKEKAFELYYLPKDSKEEKDLSKVNPSKLDELKSKLLKACDGNFDNGLYQ